MVQMTSVGQLLKETRESKNLTIKQVSNATKIRESLLEALENRDYREFSSDMHLKSFLRSYAVYLGINEEKIMALYRRERQISLDTGTEDKRNKTQSSPAVVILSKFFNVRTLVSTVMLLALAVIIWFFYSQWRAFSTPPQLEITSPKTNDIISTDTFVIEGFTDNPSVKVVLDGNEANFVSPDGKFRINAKFSEPGSKRFTIVAKNEFNKQTEVQLDLTYRPPVKETPKNKIKVVNKGAVVYSMTIQKDNNTNTETVRIIPSTPLEIEFDELIEVKNFDKNILDLYINDDSSPTTSIDSKDFSISINNNRPIITVNKNNNEQKK